MNFDLTVIWAVIIAFAVFAYVVMDGFDLGIGILFPGLAVGEERDRAMNSIAPVWDGNETWLVLGGGGLMAAFPLAYAIILPATYPLIVAMLAVNLAFGALARAAPALNPIQLGLPVSLLLGLALLAVLAGEMGPPVQRLFDAAFEAAGAVVR